MPIKSFRGLLADDTQETIHLHTNTGSTGYRIVKFQVMSPDANTNVEAVMKIYKIKQATNTSDVDFSDNTLLAAALVNDTTDRNYMPIPIVTFDNEIFNQDIYVTNKGQDNPSPVNYYIELEVVKLDLNENTVATLKDIRNETLAL
jgi:hypothetical protein|tara:strand:+ start:706 stop:1143 length:438 start_codon:yes stop_codon:yes gene_type:complete